jgi:ABC-type transport system substrate-binding protein
LEYSPVKPRCVSLLNSARLRLRARFSAFHLRHRETGSPSIIRRGPLIDADTFYDQYFRTGTTKRCNYSNPEFDKLIEEEQKAGDNKKRVALLQPAGKILMEDVPFVPLYHLANIYGAAKNLAWEMKPDEKILGWDMKIS